jgi:hypothetical protein
MNRLYVGEFVPLFVCQFYNLRSFGNNLRPSGKNLRPLGKKQDFFHGEATEVFFETFSILHANLIFLLQSSFFYWLFFPLV